MRLAAISFFALVLPGQAMTPASAHWSGDAGAAKLDRLDGICVDVYRQRLNADRPASYTYAYERRLYEAAGIDFERDTQAVARRKVQILWASHQDRFTCDGSDFPVANGSILKYAVDVRTYNMLDNAYRFWGIELNFIDGSDRRTLLDYVAVRRDEYDEDKPTYRALDGYYGQLRRYGARHCYELINSEHCAIDDQSGIAIPSWKLAKPPAAASGAIDNFNRSLVEKVLRR